MTLTETERAMVVAYAKGSVLQAEHALRAVLEARAERLGLLQSVSRRELRRCARALAQSRP